MIMGRLKIINSDKRYRKDKPDYYPNLNQINEKAFIMQKNQNKPFDIFDELCVWIIVISMGFIN